MDGLNESTDIELGNVDLMSWLMGIDFETYYAYNGSLTTPPCTQGIKWNVIADIQPISDAQLEAFTRHYAGNFTYAFGNGNNREIMPLEGRTVYKRVLGDDMGTDQKDDKHDEPWDWPWDSFIETHSGAATLGAAALVLSAMISA